MRRRRASVIGRVGAADLARDRDGRCESAEVIMAARVCPGGPKDAVQPAGAVHLRPRGSRLARDGPGAQRESASDAADASYTPSAKPRAYSQLT